MERVCLAVLLVVAAPLARAAPEPADAPSLVQRGVALFREAQFAASVTALELARTQGQLTSAEQVECAFYLASDYVALGSTQAARRELHAVVDAEPGYELPPFTSPKVAALFRDVRDEAEHAARLRALPPRRHASALELWFEPSRGGGVAYGAAFWRWRGERDFREVGLAHAGEELVARVPIDRGGTVEYYAETRAPTGSARVGSRERPLELPVTPPLLAATATRDDRKPVYKAWWLWTGVGAVAAAGLGVGLYFALRPQPTSTADAVLNFTVR